VQCPVERARIPISIQSPKERKEQIMEPKIVTKPAFKAVGLTYIGKNEKGEIPQMWDGFNQRYKEIKAIDPSCCYGLCFSTPVGVTKPEDLRPGVFEYVAAAEVADNQNIPAGMVYREVPAHKYIVFAHHGKLDKLGETYKYIYETWLPQSEYKLHSDKFDMEVYTEEFDFSSDDSRFYIYVAIQ
jgi:AraC family transcriptional regulator